MVNLSFLHRVTLVDRSAMDVKLHGKKPMRIQKGYQIRTIIRGLVAGCGCSCGPQRGESFLMAKKYCMRVMTQSLIAKTDVCEDPAGQRST